MPAGLRIGAGDAAFGAYGMPYWNARHGGYGMGGLGMFRGLGDGLGDCVMDPDTGITTCTDTSASTTTLDTGGGYYGVPTGVNPVATAPGPSASPSVTPAQIQGIAQQGFNDVFSILKLFNPVPPGTVMQTGPYGTYIARADQTGTVPSTVGIPSLTGSSGIWILLLLGVGAFVLFANK